MHEFVEGPVGGCSILERQPTCVPHHTHFTLGL